MCKLPFKTEKLWILHVFVVDFSFPKIFKEEHKLLFLQIMQCDAIRWEQFSGNVVLDSFNKAYREADNILGHTNEIKYVFILKVLFVVLHFMKMHNYFRYDFFLTRKIFKKKIKKYLLSFICFYYCFLHSQFQFSTIINLILADVQCTHFKMCYVF